MNPGLRAKILFGIVLVALIAAGLSPPIAQPAGYHDFVDQREIFGIPNFWNVMTNLPFLFFGLMGIGLVSAGKLPGGVRELRLAYLVFFIGSAWVSFGSGYYHLFPSNESLFWDRLPMTVAFAAFFSLVVGEHVSVRIGTRLLWPLLVIGPCSVIYWSYTESLGRGDLRPYALVQFLPLVLTLLILMSYRSRFGSSRYIWAMVGTYAAAKVAEALDGPLFDLSQGLMSGHAVKHVIASAGGLVLFVALMKRKPVERDS